MSDQDSSNPMPPNDMPNGPGPTQPPVPPTYVQAPYYTPPPPPAPAKPRYWIPITIGLGVGYLPWLILFMVAIIGMATSSFKGARDFDGGGNIALIRVEGVISAGSEEGGMFGSSGAGSEALISALERARKSSKIKAIVLRINSPGGSPAGSEEVYNEIMRIRQSGKLVYTSMGDVAASGGYYIASASDKIYADASTITGSIGVIFETADMSGLFKKIGYSPTVIKTGKFKDIGNPARPMTDDEKVLIKEMLMDTYGQFVSAVSRGRNIPEAQVKAIADGRVFTGTKAQKLKLIDSIGGLHETVRAAAKAAGVRGEPRVVDYGHRGILSSLFGSDGPDSSSKLDGLLAKMLLSRLTGTENQQLQEIR